MEKRHNGRFKEGDMEYLDSVVQFLSDYWRIYLAVVVGSCIFNLVAAFAVEKPSVPKKTAANIAAKFAAK